MPQAFPRRVLSSSCRGTSALAILVLLRGGPLEAGDWPGWRGAEGLGVSEETELPENWSAEESILWRTELPGWGNTAPAVVGARVYVTSQTEDDALWVHCLDATSGEKRWSTEVAKGTEKHHELHNMATPTCVATDSHVWALFGTGDLACLDTAGRPRWKRDLTETHGEYRILWGMGSSPLLAGGRLYIACMTAGPSYVLAVDAKTGDDVWKTERKLDCVGEAPDSYSSPILLRRGETSELVVAGADHVNAYDLATGKERWISGGLKITADYGRTIASPTAANGIVYAVASGYGGLGRVIALDLTKPAEGDITESHRVWTYERYSPDCPTPIVYQGLVWLLRDGGEGSCLRAKTGEVLWRQRLFRGDCKASPVAGDGKVYFLSKNGETLVLAAEPEYREIARNRLEGVFIASPAISGGKVFLRSRDKLWAVGSAKKAE